MLLLWFFFLFNCRSFFYGFWIWTFLGQFVRTLVWLIMLLMEIWRIELCSQWYTIFSDAMVCLELEKRNFEGVQILSVEVVNCTFDSKKILGVGMLLVDFFMSAEISRTFYLLFYPSWTYIYLHSSVNLFVCVGIECILSFSSVTFPITYKMIQLSF